MTSDNWDLSDRAKNGVMARAFPTEDPEKVSEFEIQHDPYDISQHFDLAGKKSPFCTAGVMQDYKVLTFDLVEKYEASSVRLETCWFRRAKSLSSSIFRTRSSRPGST